MRLASHPALQIAWKAQRAVATTGCNRLPRQIFDFFSEILSASSDVKAESPEQDHLCVTEITLADMRVAPDLERPSK